MICPISQENRQGYDCPARKLDGRPGSALCQLQQYKNATCSSAHWIIEAIERSKMPEEEPRVMKPIKWLAKACFTVLDGSPSKLCGGIRCEDCVYYKVNLEYHLRQAEEG